MIPPAVGLAASVATQGTTDIVTIEYLDPQDGYHGAVFTMPRHAADELQKNVRWVKEPLKADFPRGICPPASDHRASIALVPLVSDEPAIPAEYRALIYERLVHRMRTGQPQWQVYRSGNAKDGIGCGEWQLMTTVEDFHKGNAVKRVLVGPFGLFVATASLSYRIAVRDSQGVSLLDERMRAVVRGDNESLDLSDKVAKSIERKVKTLQMTATRAGLMTRSVL